MSDDGLLLKVSQVSKRFPGVVALDKVSFHVKRGEVHALLGENGAGKSTLLKILAGAQYQDEGTIEFNGAMLGRELPFERQRMGIVTVYQEFTLMPNLSVAENIFVGREPVKRKFISWPTMLREAKMVTDKLDLRVDPMTPVYALSVAEQQMVEIARALTMNARLIILDEPTAVVVVSSELPEVISLCDRIVTVKEGRVTGEMPAREATEEKLMKLMVLTPGEHHAHADAP